MDYSINIVKRNLVGASVIFTDGAAAVSLKI